MRPLKNVQFCSSSRKTKILTADIHISISRIEAARPKDGASRKGKYAILIKLPSARPKRRDCEEHAGKI